jgi:hypothetical protein
MIDFAKMKLKKGGILSEDARIAAASIRIIVDFDPTMKSPRAREEKLVESYMRVVFAVPDHLQFMHCGTPSEPLLGEAAAQLLNQNMNFEKEVPELLGNLLNHDLLVREAR